MSTEASKPFVALLYEFNPFEHATGLGLALGISHRQIVDPGWIATEDGAAVVARGTSVSFTPRPDPVTVTGYAVIDETGKVQWFPRHEVRPVLVAAGVSPLLHVGPMGDVVVEVEAAP